MLGKLLLGLEAGRFFDIMVHELLIRMRKRDKLAPADILARCLVTDC